MKKLFLAVAAMFVMTMVAAPSVDAQEYGEKAKSKWLKGTMTPPGGEVMEIGYKLMKGEDGMKGWIVGEAEGEKYEIPMKDIEMTSDYVSYSWSPPDNASMVISCNLKKQDDGGYAGDCTDGEDTGQMSIAPMEAAEHMEKAKKMNPCSG